MAKYSRGMIVFGIGIMMMTVLFCSTMANDDVDVDSYNIHAINRDAQQNKQQKHKHNCHSSLTGTGEECTSEDDHLGLYADVDDTFKNVQNAFKNKHVGFPSEHDDSPDIANNHVNVLGH